MRGYLAYFKLRLIASLQYRTAALAGISTQFFWGGMYLMIYAAFYGNSLAEPPISYIQLSSYIWLQQAFLVLVMLPSRDSEISEMIRTGGVAYELCRPYNLYFFWFAKLIAQRLAAMSLRCLPLLLFAVLLPAPYGLRAPVSPQAFLLFLLTLAIGLTIVVTANLLIHLLTLMTLEQTGITALTTLLWEILSGNVIPVPLMPPTMQSLVLILPCRLASDLPFRIYSGHIPLDEGLAGIGLQLFWFTIMTGGGLHLMRWIQNRITVQGG